MIKVLGALIESIRDSRPRGRRQEDWLLAERQFNREITKERIRATRRNIPFCLITIEMRGESVRRSPVRKLVRILYRHLRLTDQKGRLGEQRFGVLLVDTPELGGRACLDRLAGLIEAAGIQASLSLKVHDPEGFSDDDYPEGSSRRRADDIDESWTRIRAVSTDSQLPVNHGTVEVSSEDPMISFQSWNVKRVIDILGASAGLVVAGPVLLAAMAAIRLVDRGPAIFTQTREGYRGQPFTIYKLRTMVIDAEKQQSGLREHSHRDGPAFKIERDPRVTRVGHFLRKTCIDELPQLLNVVKGEMSLVGPRPLPWHESRACERWHRRRLDVRPGMTCYWQVNKDAAETFNDWMRMDLRYVDRAGVLGDFRLIAKTITVPMLGRGSQ